VIGNIESQVIDATHYARHRNGVDQPQRLGAAFLYDRNRRNTNDQMGQKGSDSL
jgi:hypothetical protein